MPYDMAINWKLVGDITRAQAINLRNCDHITARFDMLPGVHSIKKYKCALQVGPGLFLVTNSNQFESFHKKSLQVILRSLQLVLTMVFYWIPISYKSKIYMRILQL